MLAVIRIRGSTGIRKEAEDTASLLRLHRINHMVLVRDDKQTLGMLRKLKDYVTWGEIDRDTLELLLRNRLLLKGRKKPEEDGLESVTGFKTFSDMADSILNGKVTMNGISNAVPVFRLHPPKGGYEKIRKQYTQGGSSGYRGKDINTLIRKMLKPGSDLNGEDKN
ncbi:MAG: 50S ribosomal protein L30 [Candidatus Thermoplasmatota archaeon]|nr:50S ribosomal protein L30 [Candidatus Thermoplasmatota archaeon]